MNLSSSPTPGYVARHEVCRTGILRRPARSALVGISLCALLAVAASVGYVIREVSSDAFRGGKLTTNTWSHDLPSSSERVRFLGRYVKLRSEVFDCEFHIVYHDNGFAPSDWHIAAGIRVEPTNLPAWLEDATPLATPDDFDYRSWLAPRWKVGSAPRFFRRGTTRLAVFVPEGVLVLANQTH